MAWTYMRAIKNQGDIAKQSFIFHLTTAHLSLAYVWFSNNFLRKFELNENLETQLCSEL